MIVKLASRTIRADVAFGGAFYAIVDSEAVGLPIDAAHLPELRRMGMEIKHAIEAAQTIVHPLDAGLAGHLRHDLHRAAERRDAPTFATSRSSPTPKSIDRPAAPALRRSWRWSTRWGCSAPTGRSCTKSLIGTRFSGRVASRTQVGECQAIVPEIEGSAWITGEHTFLVDDTDPLKNGFRIQGFSPSLGRPEGRPLRRGETEGRPLRRGETEGRPLRRGETEGRPL